MSDRTSQQSFTYGLGRSYLDFQFKTNAGASPLLSTVDGTTAATTGAGSGPTPMIASITRTGTGVLVVQLNDKFNKLMSVGVDLDDTLADGAYCTFGSVVNEGSATTGIAFTIRTLAATGTATDFANRVVRVSISFRNTVSGR